MGRKKKKTKARPKPGAGKTSPSSPIAADMEKYVFTLGGLLHSLDPLMSVLSSGVKDSRKEHDKFVTKYCSHTTGTQKEPLILVPANRQAEFFKKRYAFKALSVASGKLPRSFLLMMVAQFDWLTGQMIRHLFGLVPEKLNESEKQLTYSELVGFNSIERARHHIVEKEVEGVLRKSHKDQFKWLEKHFNMPLRKDLETWPTFIEVTQRRHLFAHCDGVVSEQYIDTCRVNGIPDKELPEVGKLLSVDRDYFQKAHDCLVEIGVKLVQVLWRKHEPNALSIADHVLNFVAFEQIVDERYDLALAILKFAIDGLPKLSSEEARITLLLNLAQVHKWSGDNTKCTEVLSQVDWSAMKEKYRLGEAVLREDYTAAAELMQRVALTKDIDKQCYTDWPIFQKFRKTQLFQKSFEEIYGHPFESVATPLPENEDSGEAD